MTWKIRGSDLRSGVLGLVAALAVTCAEVEEIELGVCGNGVLEPDLGEDCDSSVGEANTVCGAARSDAECRYTCLADEDGEPTPCPTGWGCGRDGICRAHSGTASVEPFAAEPGLILDVADFDGDGIDDVSWLHVSRLAVSYPSGARLETVEIPLEPANAPSIADINGDGRADWIIPSESGLWALRGTDSRFPRPITFQSLPLSDEIIRFIPLDLVPDVVMLDGTPTLFSGDESLLISKGEDATASFSRTVTLTSDIPGDLDALLDTFIVAQLDDARDPTLLPPSSPSSEEFVIAFDDVPEVVVYRPTLSPRAFGVDVSLETAPPTRVSLPVDPSRLIGARHVNLAVNGADSALDCGGTMARGDEHLDLLVEGADDQFYVSYGLGDGTFHDDPCELDDVPTSLPPNNAFTLLPALSSCTELRDVGHIDDDGALDVVTRTAVHTTALAGGPQATDLCVQPATSNWTHARIADFDGDGHNDVVASSKLGLDYLRGSGGASLTPTLLPGPGAAELMTVGDFDADGLPDVAIADRRADGLDRVSLSFGEPLALPTAPIEIGTVQGIFELRLLEIGAFVPDEAADLVIGREGNEIDGRRFVGIVDGRADRQLRSAFLQARAFGNTGLRVPLTGAVGRYGPDGDLQAAVVGFSPSVAAGAPGVMWGLGLAAISGDVNFTLLGKEDVLLDDIPTFDEGLGGVTTAAVDIEADGRDELIVVASGSSASGVVQIALSSLDDDAGGTVSPFLEIEGASYGGATITTGDPREAWFASELGVPRTCHLSPSGEPHLLLSVVERQECSSGDIAEHIENVIYVISPAELAAMKRGDAVSLTADARIAAPEGETIMGFSCFNGDDDPEEELAVLLLGATSARCGASDIDASPEELTARVATVPFSGGAFQPATTYAELPAEVVESLSQPSINGPVVYGLAGGDIDGDGVDDLVLGAGRTTIALKGRAVNP